MNAKQQTKISKRLSLILRHNPQSIGIQLDSSGWAKIDELLQALNSHGIQINHDILTQVVNDNPKKRFEFNASESQIRARQGHSLKVDLGYQPTTPPDKLYHGTPEKFLTSIFKQGLQKQQRHHVHMSEDIPLMLEVAKRRGVPSLLEINAGEMVKHGHHFFHTDNDVWLTDNIPPEFITRINIPSTK